MLPVSAWPPGPPGASLSPFGGPREINLRAHSCHFILDKGAWIVNTGENQVVMFLPSWQRELYEHQPSRAPGTGYLPGQWQWEHRRRVSRETPFCEPPRPRKRLTHDQYLEAWRAWQRHTGQTNPPIRPLPGRVPPNFTGFHSVKMPERVLVPCWSSDLVLADGQNVVIKGGGRATITQAYSV